MSLSGFGVFADSFRPFAGSFLIADKKRRTIMHKTSIDFLIMNHLTGDSNCYHETAFW